MLVGMRLKTSVKAPPGEARKYPMVIGNSKVLLLKGNWNFQRLGGSSSSETQGEVVRPG